jgi:putative Ca2+/H+ antiporter (TMEM165/GDT1 family)
MIGSKTGLGSNGVTSDGDKDEIVINAILSKIMENKSILWIANVHKIVVICLSELVGRCHENWVYERIASMIECILEVILYHKMKQNQRSSYEDEEKERDEIEFENQYENSLVYIKNSLINTNEL